MATKKGGLGKGLDALFVDNDINDGTPSELNISEIEPDREQPRTKFDEQALSELTASVSEHGVLQPILVRPLPNGGYRIIAGERRFRAAHAAGLTKIPALIKSVSDLDAIALALIENLQRDDLDPVDEALGYKHLMDTADITQEQAAEKVGKPRSTVANSLRLLALPDDVLSLISEKKLTAGHAKALLSLKDTDSVSETAKMIADKQLSVREAERICSRKKREKPVPKPKESIAAEVEIALRDTLGVEVSVKYNDGKGTLSLNFYSKEQLLDFANRLAVEK